MRSGGQIAPQSYYVVLRSFWKLKVLINGPHLVIGKWNRCRHSAGLWLTKLPMYVATRCCCEVEMSLFYWIYSLCLSVCLSTSLIKTELSLWLLGGFLIQHKHEVGKYLDSDWLSYRCIRLRWNLHTSAITCSPLICTLNQYLQNENISLSCTRWSLV